MSSDSIDADLIESLRQRIDELEERVDELEDEKNDPTNTTSGGSGVGGADSRDQAVLDQLNEGDIVSVAGLKKLYQTHTDIRTKNTLKNRVKALTNRPEFDIVAPGKWQFVGGEPDE